MKRRSVGELEVSVVGIGGNNFGTDFFGARCDQDEVTKIVNTALDEGINLFDTAEEYSVTSFIGEGHSEEFLGVAVGSRRDEAVIASKFSSTNAGDPSQRGAARIVAAVEDSLRRLGTDRIDLYQQHSPDPETPIDEILAALDALVTAGKVREIGCCNYTAELLDGATASARDAGTRLFRSCQVQFSVLERPDPAVLDAAQRNGMPVLAYFPLASGLLTGKYQRGVTPPADSRFGADGVVSRLLREGTMARRPPLSDERLATVEQLSDLAAARGHTLLELAMSWLACQASVGSILTGVTKVAQVLANAAAADWELTADELAEIDVIVEREA